VETTVEDLNLNQKEKSVAGGISPGNLDKLLSGAGAGWVNRTFMWGKLYANYLNPWGPSQDQRATEILQEYADARQAIPDYLPGDVKADLRKRGPLSDSVEDQTEFRGIQIIRNFITEFSRASEDMRKNISGAAESMKKSISEASDAMKSAAEEGRRTGPTLGNNKRDL
jgi:hypothetical protein